MKPYLLLFIPLLGAWGPLGPLAAPVAGVPLAAPVAPRPIAEFLLIKGQVVDAAGQGVPQAAVALVGTALATATDAVGKFALTVLAAVLAQLPDGPVQLRLSYAGHLARLVELAPNLVDLAGTAEVTVLATPGEVQVMRTPLPRRATPIRRRPVFARQPPPPPPPPTPTAGEAPTIRSAEKKRANAFAWPPPHPSAYCLLPERFTTGVQRLGQVDARLRVALVKARFQDPAYYSIPEGFALVTRIEQLDGQDNPLPEPNRWAPEAVAGSSLAAFLRNLVSARTGRFRVVVFAVTATAFAPTDETVDKQQAIDWLTHGTTSLPTAVGRLPWTADSHCTALVYEFEKKENRPAALVDASLFSGRQHLSKAGIAVGF
ncbi:hypothetical protein [Hymenobacter coccineus]|uniref:Carboxypeptidase regulatory-like domain-containing protein n=1 Tax=Hymenobacter coccineus TaxID=1908235 RepID=A0A1G1TG01_9BACT|nr:hypothetical protein [Hymenobacter coccineus]OGX89797.1 hypothetical protein BEN49_24445 [Hymenobacter coccineus]